MNKFPFVAFIALALEVFGSDCMSTCPFGSFCKDTKLENIKPGKYYEIDTTTCVQDTASTPKAYTFKETCRKDGAGMGTTGSSALAICLKRVLTHCRALPGHYRNIGVFRPDIAATTIDDSTTFPYTGRYTPINWNYLKCAALAAGANNAAVDDDCLEKAHLEIEPVSDFVFNTIQGDPTSQTATEYGKMEADDVIKVGSSIDNSLIFPKCSTAGKFSVKGAIGYTEEDGCSALTDSKCPHGHIKINAKDGVNGNACVKCGDYEPVKKSFKNFAAGFGGTVDNACSVCPPGKFSKSIKTPVTLKDLQLKGNCLYRGDDVKADPTCPSGSYCTGDQTKKKCPGDLTSNPGATSESDCFCPGNNMKKTDKNKCVSTCPDNTICTYTPNQVELPCPTNSKAPGGAGTVYDCKCEMGYHMFLGPPVPVEVSTAGTSEADTAKPAYFNTYAAPEEKKDEFGCKKCPVGYMCYDNLKVVCSWCVSKGAAKGAATTATQASAVSLLVVFCYIFILTPLRLVTA